MLKAGQACEHLGWFVVFRVSSPGRDPQRSDPGPPRSLSATGTRPLTLWLCFETGESRSASSALSGRGQPGQPRMLLMGRRQVGSPQAPPTPSICVLVSSQLLQLQKSGEGRRSQCQPHPTAPGEGRAAVPTTSKYLPARRHCGPERGRSLKALQKKGPRRVCSTRGPLPSGLSRCQTATAAS